MKVLQYHVNVRLEKGGTIRFLLDLSLCLARHGHEVTIASPDPADIPAPKLIAAITTRHAVEDVHVDEPPIEEVIARFYDLHDAHEA